MKLLRIECGHLVAPGRGKKTDDGNRDRLLLPVRQAILILEKNVVAIDSGLRVESYRPRYGEITLQPPSITVEQQLADMGLSSTDITHVLLTHGHYDHTGGLLYSNGDPVFPQAQIVIHAREMQLFAETPARSDRFYDGEIAAFLAQAGPLILQENAGSVAGINYLLTGGHTAGHLVYHKDGVVFSGDLLSMASSVRQPGPHVSDSNPAVAASWRRRLRRGEFGSEYFLCHGSGKEMTYHLDE